MAAVFDHLTQDKQDKIIGACVEEFVERGFAAASTNRMVEKIGISKGSLFQYFGSKEKLYEFLLEKALRALIDEVNRACLDLPPRLTDRLRFLAGKAFEIYRKYPDYFRLVLTMTDSDAMEFQAPMVRKFAGESKGFFFGLFKGVETSTLRLGLENTVDLIKWMLTGIKSEILQAGYLSGGADEMREWYFKRLDTVLAVLEGGIYLPEEKR